MLQEPNLLAKLQLVSIQLFNKTRQNIISRQIDTTVLVHFASSAVSEGDLHKRLLLTMWNSNSKTRYLVELLVSCSTFPHHMHISAILFTENRNDMNNLLHYRATFRVCVSYMVFSTFGRQDMLLWALLPCKRLEGFYWNESHVSPAMLCYKEEG